MQSENFVIRQGANVIGPEGPLGTVAHVVVDEPTRQISDFVLRRPDGHQWLIPASDVADATAATVSLRASWADLSSKIRPYAADELETLSPGKALPASRSLELREEELNVRTQTQQVGAVELRNEVISERRVLDIPVWHEELLVEHQPVDPPQPLKESIGEDRIVLRVALREQVASVDKQPVVKEVVRAGRRRLQDTQHIETRVRREVADVQTEGDVRLNQPESSGRG
ncbi:MAG: YsnF/AvaK domain-containing protein [Chloroflexi bacterium]|nr:YsnF/AvaK domain-containing protein [Chloroflexota bacterium]